MVLVMDYKKLGLRVGLEIHQQLASGTKLFCRCPIMKSEEFPLEIHRKMRPVQSELGEEDPAALFEYLRNRTFVYKFNPESSCLIELDESPPLSMNENVLKIAVQLSKLLHCSLVSEIHVMRKTVIDGSAVTGFQRTSLIATDGYIETSFGQLAIQTINIEEDSAPAVSRGENIEYRLDRLGIPLVEIATGSTIGSPEQAKEAAEKIGLLLRGLDVVRGIGSIRQDVNISIKEGSRVEIKGFQQLDLIPTLVENEAARQISLIEIKEALQKKGFHEIKTSPIDVTKTFQKTQCNFVRKAIEGGQHVFALTLPKFAGLLKKQCGDRTFGKELSAYPGAYGFGITHSDEDLEKYKLTNEFVELRKELRAAEEDVVLIVVGNNSSRAINALVNRINYCIIGVPNETRLADGIGSKYGRPLPGSGRLYPESDVPAISTTRFRDIEVPKTLEERKKELDIPEQLAEQIVKSKYYGWYNELKKYDPVLAATIFLSNYKDLGRRGFDISKITKESLDTLLRNISEGDIPKNAVMPILEALCAGTSIDSAISVYYRLPDEQLKALVQSTINENPGKNDSALIGIILGKANGKADGKKVADLVKELRK